MAITTEDVLGPFDFDDYESKGENSTVDFIDKKFLRMVVMNVFNKNETISVELQHESPTSSTIDIDGYKITTSSRLLYNLMFDLFKTPDGAPNDFPAGNRFTVSLR